MASRQDMLDSVYTMTDLALNLLLASRIASEVLKRAHTENWADDDMRWDAHWTAVNQQFDAERKRLGSGGG